MTAEIGLGVEMLLFLHALRKMAKIASKIGKSGLLNPLLCGASVSEVLADVFVFGAENDRF